VISTPSPLLFWAIMGAGVIVVLMVGWLLGDQDDD
jgi:hypothetical protein